MAQAALEAVREGQIRIIPDHFKKVYYNWMENIQDWCISRQLWWGHRIPVWYCEDCGEMTSARQDPNRCKNCGSTDLYQDPASDPVIQDLVDRGGRVKDVQVLPEE